MPAKFQGPPMLRPFKPGERRQNADGSYSTEVTTTFQTPDGKWVNAPSLWMGPKGPAQFDETDEDGIMQTMQNYEQSAGPSFQRFGNVDEAVASAEAKSKAGGVESKMVTININGKRVKVGSEFLSLSPEQQNSTVDEIAASMGASAPEPQAPIQQPETDAAKEFAAFASGATQNPAKARYDQLPGWQKPLVAGNDILQTFANGATFGFGDKAVAAARAPFTGNTYERELEDARAKTEGARRRGGGASTVAEIAGSIATPVGVASKGATLTNAGRGLAARTGLMAAEGAGYGALTAAGNDQDLGTGALLGAAGGAGGNLLGTAISKGVGKVAGAFNKAPKQATAQELKAAAQRSYEQADQAGVVFNGQGVDDLTRNVIDDATEHGFDPANEPGVSAVLKRLAKMRGENVTLKGLDTLRKVASNGFDPMKPSNNKLLSQIIGRIDELAENASPQNVLMGDAVKGATALKDARKSWHTARKLDTVDELLGRAELNAGSAGSGGNIENATRQQLKRILTNKGMQRGFSKAEQEATRKAVMGTGTQNALRLAGKLSPQGNGLMMALGAGGAVAMPTAAIPAMIAGFGAKKVAEHLARKSVNELVTLIANGGIPPKLAENVIQKLAKSKRDALSRSLMALGVNRGNEAPAQQ